MATDVDHGVECPAGGIRVLDEMKISSSSTDSGESEDTIETPYNYDPIMVGFNSSYFIDFLKAIGNSGEVAPSLPSSLKQS